MTVEAWLRLETWDTDRMWITDGVHSTLLLDFQLIPMGTSRQDPVILRHARVQPSYKLITPQAVLAATSSNGMLRLRVQRESLIWDGALSGATPAPAPAPALDPTPLKAVEHVLFTSSLLDFPGPWLGEHLNRRCSWGNHRGRSQPLLAVEVRGEALTPAEERAYHELYGRLLLGEVVW